MAQALQDLGPRFEHARSRTARLVGLFEAFDAEATRLADVWKAVEWYHSCDWTVEQAEAAASARVALPRDERRPCFLSPEELSALADVLETWSSEFNMGGREWVKRLQAHLQSELELLVGGERE